MKYSAFTFLIIGLLFVSLVHPVSAGAVDNGIEMVAKGIDAYVELKAARNLENNFGVTFGNTSEMEDLPPSKKLVYMVGAAEQHPFKIPWVRDTLAHDFVYYYLIGLFIIIITNGLDILQKAFPEEIAEISERFTGHEGFFDYSMSFKTTLKLALLPVFALPLIEAVMLLEQQVSAGMMQDSLEYISLSTSTVGVYLMESIAYSVCGSLFAIRIQYINMFSANILKILLLLGFSWWISQHIGKTLCYWFISALAMRPIVLWYSCIAVQHIASFDNTIDALSVTQFDMSLVIILSFITSVVLVLWPVLLLTLSIVSNYILGTGFKLIKISNSIQMMKRLRN